MRCHVDSRQQAAQRSLASFGKDVKTVFPSHSRRKPPALKQNETRTTDRDWPGETQNAYRALN